MLTYVRRNSEQVLATEFHETFLHPTFDNQGLKYYCSIPMWITLQLYHFEDTRT